MENQAPPEATMRIDLSSADDISCDKCGDLRFEPIYLIKRLSAIVSPTGKEEMIPLGPPICPPIFACLACGHVNEYFLPGPVRAKKQMDKDGIQASAEPPSLIKIEE